MPKRGAGHSYLALLVAIMFALVAYPALRGPAGSPVLARLFVTAVFLAGGWVVFVNRRLVFFAVVLGGPALLGLWFAGSLPTRHAPTASAAFHLVSVSFHLFVVGILVRAVYREPTVSANAVAALCGYLLLGVAFGHAYCLVEEAVPGSFNGLTGDRSDAEVHFQFTYFSFVTLTTVGYGDITPAKDTARSLALVEAITGQFYLAVLVADLVGKRVAQTLSEKPPPRE
jgi:hypothetical protein